MSLWILPTHLWSLYETDKNNYWCHLSNIIWQMAAATLNLSMNIFCMGEGEVVYRRALAKIMIIMDGPLAL